MTPSTISANKPQGTIVVFIRDLTDPFFTPMLTTIEQMADAKGYGVVFAKKSNTDHQHVDYMRLIGNTADGVIFLGEGTSRLYEVEHLMAMAKPFVIVQGKKQIEGATQLTVDNVKASFEAMSYLHKCGHRRIVHISAPMYYFEVLERSRGYEQAVKAFELEYQNKIHIDTDYDTIYDMGCRLRGLIQNERLTAAYCFNNRIATGIIDGLKDQGVRVPDNFSVIGFDDLSFRDLSRNWIPEISSVKQPQESMGAYAVEKVMDMIENGVYDASKVFHCTFVDRESVRMV